jgi:hypothetical protein
MEATWKQDDVFPIIAHVIAAQFQHHQRFITSPEIADALLRDPEARRIVDAVVQQRGSTQERTAINMVAWFSQRITMANSPWAQRFERTKVDDRWAYKPVSDAPSHINPYLPTQTMKPTANWSWRPGVVDVQGEHIEVRYEEDAGNSPYEQWIPVALIGKPTNHVFLVSWLMSSDNPSHERIIRAATMELDFYLVEKREADPWAYAKYHCNTGANMYSSVHWSYFPDGNPGERHSSSVVQLSGTSKAIFKPKR